METFLENTFHLKAKGTTIRTEVIAGATTFATMAYILAVNVNILGATGLDGGAVFVATALASVIGTVCMGLMANLPFALAPGMGLNAFFAYTVVLGMGYSPQFALAAVLTEGVIFIVLSKSGVRTKLFDSIPLSLKYAVGGGIGLFVMFIGAQNAGLVIGDGATLVKLGTLANPSTAIALIGVGITLALLVANVKGSLLIGIVATWFIGIIAQLTGLYNVSPSDGFYSLIPSGVIALPPSVMPTLGACFQGFKEIFTNSSTILSFCLVTFSFLFVDIFDTIGTLSGVASKANMLDKEGKLQGADNALLADAIATTAGAILGTSTTTTYVESAAGVAEGGRSGLTAIVVAAGFALALLFWPIFQVIPGFATATALIAVGILMMEPLKHINLGSFEELAPTVVTLISMPLFYSISDGLFFGIVTYTLVKLAGGKAKEVSALMWVLCAIYITRLVISAIS